MAKQPGKPNMKYLDFTVTEPSNWATIKRHYLLWRNQEGRKYRCEIEGCQLPEGEPVWKGTRLVLIMDHINGQKRDNRPHNLRLTCPNCDSQLHTKGGGNKGLVEDLAPNAYKVQGPDGRLTFVYVAEGGIKFGGEAIAEIMKAAGGG